MGFTPEQIKGRIKSVAKQNNADARTLMRIYMMEGPAFFAWLPKMFGKRVVVTVHGIDWQREKWQSGLGSKFIHQGEKNAANEMKSDLAKQQHV